MKDTIDMGVRNTQPIRNIQTIKSIKGIRNMQTINNPPPIRNIPVAGINRYISSDIDISKVSFSQMNKVPATVLNVDKRLKQLDEIKTAVIPYSWKHSLVNTIKTPPLKTYSDFIEYAKTFKKEYEQHWLDIGKFQGFVPDYLDTQKYSEIIERYGLDMAKRIYYSDRLKSRKEQDATYKLYTPQKMWIYREDYGRKFILDEKDMEAINTYAEENMLSQKEYDKLLNELAIRKDVEGKAAFEDVASLVSNLGELGENQETYDKLGKLFSATQNRLNLRYGDSVSFSEMNNYREFGAGSDASLIYSGIGQAILELLKIPTSGILSFLPIAGALYGAIQGERVRKAADRGVRVFDGNRLITVWTDLSERDKKTIKTIAHALGKTKQTVYNFYLAYYIKSQLEILGRELPKLEKVYGSLDDEYFSKLFK